MSSFSIMHLEKLFQNFIERLGSIIRAESGVGTVCRSVHTIGGLSIFESGNPHSLFGPCSVLIIILNYSNDKFEHRKKNKNKNKI